MRICIDAGHGGSDPGAVAADGTREKDITLAYSIELADLLTKSGHVVMMTRINDDYVGLSLRAQRADDFNADCLVSLHANANSSAAANGAWVIYDDKTSKENGVALAREIFDAMDRVPGITDADPEREIYPDGTAWVGYRQLTVISETKKTPSVLVELGFLTNPDDLADLLNLELQTKICTAIAAGIRTWGVGKGMNVHVPEPVAEPVNSRRSGVLFDTTKKVKAWRKPVALVYPEESGPREAAASFALRTVKGMVESAEAQEALSSVKKMVIGVVLQWLEELLGKLLGVGTGESR